MVSKFPAVSKYIKYSLVAVVLLMLGYWVYSTYFVVDEYNTPLANCVTKKDANQATKCCNGYTTPYENEDKDKKTAGKHNNTEYNSKNKKNEKTNWPKQVYCK